MNGQCFGQPPRGATVTVLGSNGRPRVRTLTSQYGEYAAIGFSDVGGLVAASAPVRRAATARLLPNSAQPVNPLDPRS
jgi:hypothetical protein